MAYIYDLSDTWNAAGTTFFGIKMNVTNSASASGSKLLSLQVASTEYFGVDKDGNVTIGNGGDLNISSATGGDASKIYNDAEDLYFSTNGSNRMLINSSGNIGIGNTGPGYRLDIAAGDTTAGLGYGVRIRANSTAAAGGLQFTDSGVTVQWGYLAATATSVTLDATNSSTLVFRTGNTERMRIDSSGNVGVGTSSPSSKLTVGGNPPSSGAIAGVGSSGGTSLALSDNVNSSLYVRHPSGAPATIGTDNGGALAFATNGSTERMRIDSTGNVGIGTSSPSKKLEVGALGVFRLQTGSSTMDCTPTAGAADGFVWNVSSGCYYDWSVGGSSRMRLGSNGALAIGGTGTDASLHIQQAYGGYNRLTQMSPSGTSNNAFNLMAAKNSGGGDNWWSWGVRTDAVWCLVPGVDSALTSSTGIYFDSSAAAYKPGGGTWSATSDARVKSNIAPITDASSRIMSLKPASFDYRVPEAHEGRVSDRGFIAQEFEEVYPHSVTEQEMVCEAEQALFADGDKVKAIGLGTDFFADLVALVQEQQATINDLRARVAQLEGN